MPQKSVDQLREELRSLGYLSRGIERWFALDPWRSHAFWTELVVVASKAALLIAPFVAAFCTFVTMYRNHVTAGEAVVAASVYLAFAFLSVAVVVIVSALLLRVRAEAGVQNPRILTVVAIAVTTLLALLLAAWWSGFENAPSRLELALGIALLAVFFLISVTTLAAATLSFSIFDTGHIPQVHRARTGALLTGSTALIAILLAIPMLLQARPETTTRPQQIVTTPTARRVALVAVDGLSYELAATRPQLLAAFGRPASAVRLTTTAAPPERWATIGTGTAPDVHGVHTVEGIRLIGSDRVLQAVSRFDFVLGSIAPAVGLSERQPLPPTARTRDYAWETFASRGVRASSINWWASASSETPALRTIGQETIFATARRGTTSDAASLAIAVDRVAIDATLTEARKAPQFITVYLPALDILLNRIDADSTARVTSSTRVLDAVDGLVATLRSAGYDIILLGVPGQRQSGSAVLASSVPLAPGGALLDVAPTLYDLLGFPASAEMKGRSLLPDSRQLRVASYGDRTAAEAAASPTPEYYENLKSLGYIQ